MKGLVLCAGRGTRLRPLTYTIAKQLIPVANRPVIHYNLNFLKNAGIRELAVVVNPDNHHVFKDFLKDGSELNMKIDYVIQQEPRGIADAVYKAREFLKEDPFLLILGDNLIFDDITPSVEKFKSSQCEAMVLLAPVEDPRAYGVAVVENDHIKRVVEKPKEPPSNLAIVGIYMFRSQIFEAIENIKPSQRGELEITDAIEYLIEKGYDVKARTVRGWWKDTGKPEDLLEANRQILDDMKLGDIKGHVDSSSKIQGRVSVGENSQVIESIIRGPVIIGSNCAVKRSYVGPYTSIGDDVEIEQSEIENSILMSKSKVSKVRARIDSSVLGQSSEIHQNGVLPRVMKVVIGDLSIIEL